MRIVRYDEELAHRYAVAAVFFDRIHKLFKRGTITEKQYMWLRTQALLGNLKDAESELDKIMDKVRMNEVWGDAK